MSVLLPDEVLDGVAVTLGALVGAVVGGSVAVPICGALVAPLMGALVGLTLLGGLVAVSFPKSQALQSTSLLVGAGVFFSCLLHLASVPLSSIFLEPGDGALALCASYLRLMGWFYFLSFVGHTFVGWFRGNGRMNITFWGTTLQIVSRVVGTYLLVDALGLDAVALATGLGWVLIVLFHSSIFYLGWKGIWPKRLDLPLS